MKGYKSRTLIILSPYKYQSHDKIVMKDKEEKYHSRGKSLRHDQSTRKEKSKLNDLPLIHTIKAVEKIGLHHYGKGEPSNSSSMNEKRHIQEG